MMKLPRHLLVSRARRAFTTSLMQQDAFPQTIGDCEVRKFRLAMEAALEAIGAIKPAGKRAARLSRAEGQP